MDAFNFANQEPEQELPASDEELIKLLGLSATAGNNGGPLHDLVRDLDLDQFNGPSTVVPTVAPMSNESIQGQFVVGNCRAPQQLSTIAYVDLDSSETENTQYHLSGGYMINNEASVLPTTTQEVSSSAPPSPVAVQDTREAAGGKAKGRRREPKVKLYQRTEPLGTPEEEKRRQNAINAKVNRDKKKNEKQELMNQVESLTAENTQLKTENTKLTNKLEVIESQLKALCKQFNVPLVILASVISKWFQLGGLTNFTVYHFV